MRPQYETAEQLCCILNAIELMALLLGWAQGKLFFVCHSTVLGRTDRMNPGINSEVFSLALAWDAEQGKNSVNTMFLVDLYGNEDSDFLL